MREESGRWRGGKVRREGGGEGVKKGEKEEKEEQKERKSGGLHYVYTRVVFAEIQYFHKVLY